MVLAHFIYTTKDGGFNDIVGASEQSCTKTKYRVKWGQKTTPHPAKRF